MTERSSCRHCYGEIIPCPTPSLICKGWKHVQFLDSMPIGAHYCAGRSVNPVAEPAAAETAELRELFERAVADGGP